MGLSHGASPTEVKLRFYELAKLTHPDAVRDAPPTAGQPTFVEVLSAFEALVAEEAAPAASAGATAPNAAARGGAGPARRTSRAAAARRKKTLSEVLCERLEEEPSAAMAVWTDLKQRGGVGEGDLLQVVNTPGGSGKTLTLATLLAEQEEIRSRSATWQLVEGLGGCDPPE